MIKKYNIEVFRGDTLPIALTLKTKDGTPIDITNKKFILTVKSDLNSPDTSALIQKTVTTHTDAPNGKTEIKLGNLDTDKSPNKYYYDIEMVDTVSGDVNTILFGEFVIYADVTRTT